MSIASEITRINNNIASAYTACNGKGATMPATQNSANLATCISSISGGSATLTTKTITQNGTYNASSDNADGYSSVTVNVSGGGTKYGATGGTFLGNVDANGVLSYDSNTPTDLVFTGVRDLGNTALNLRFTYTTYTANIQANRFVGLNSIKSASFPDLENISGKYAMNYTFSNCENFASLSIPNLTSISGNYAMNAMCNECISLNSVNFAKLESITGSYALRYAFQYCLQLTTLSFSSLTSTGFGSNTNQFNYMLSNVTGCTVHFPSNLQSVIGSWSSVTSGFGGTNTTVLFDLPATT